MGESELRESIAQNVTMALIARPNGSGLSWNEAKAVGIDVAARVTLPAALSGDSRANGEPGPGGVYVTEERLAAALHEVYCRRNAPMHSAKDHSAALIPAAALREADPS